MRISKKKRVYRRFMMEENFYKIEDLEEKCYKEKGVLLYNTPFLI